MCHIGINSRPLDDRQGSVGVIIENIYNNFVDNKNYFDVFGLFWHGKAIKSNFHPS